MAYDENGGIFTKDGGDNHILDRSKVRILLCDNNEKSSMEVLRLLCKCSYQVTSVRTGRQVIDALNVEGSEIDIILAEVDLPVSKGLKMLKYITRNKELHRIPIIMMSSQDEVSVVVKCLRHGAADYLVKPLRTNELLNLWTHMWRRRHMLGLAEKKILNYDFDFGASDPSDANTNSTTFLSDDTDDKSKKNMHPEESVSNLPEYMPSNFKQAKESATVEITIMNISKNRPNVADDQPGDVISFPRKSELKVGENSAFFSYVKSKLPVNGNSSKLTAVNGDIELSLDLHKEKLQVVSAEQVQEFEIRHGQQAYNHDGFYQNSFLNGKNVSEVQTSKMAATVSRPTEFPHGCELSNGRSVTLHMTEEMNQVEMSDSLPLNFNMPLYLSQPMNQGIVQSTPHCYYASLDGVEKNCPPSIMPQYGSTIQPHYPHGHMHMMGSFAYYPPVHAGGQPRQVASIPQLWPPSIANSSSTDVKPVRIERREAALMKFRQKRKDRCFDKKIRYVNRKRLAERRPRVRGQFVRQTNGVNVDLNGRAPIDDDSEDDEDDDDEEEYGSEY